MVSRRRSALAGAAAALVWAAVEPLDQRLFRCGYSDIALLGKAVTRRPAWPAVGAAIHAANGAVFGLAYHEVRARVHRDPIGLGVTLALIEHATLYPLAPLVARFHPARTEPDVAGLATVRGFGQATFRHALFGAVLGGLAR